jgi:hypothetical protein
VEIGPLYVERLAPRFPQISHFTPVVISERLLEQVKMCEIRSEIYGASDHCPIVLDIEGTFEATDDTKTTDTANTTDAVEATDPSPA